MLMEETKAAARARLSGRVEGVSPPPISTRPPTAVSPDTRKKKKKTTFKRLKDTISQNKSNLIWTPDLRWHWWQTWGVNAGQGSRPTLCGIPQSQPSRRWWPSEWRLRWGRWCPEPDRWKHLQKDTAVLLLLCSALWKEMCRFCHLFRSLFKLYSNGITEE